MKQEKLLWALIPVFASLYQYFIKLTALDMGNKAFDFEWFLQAISTPWVWMALLTEILAFVLWIRVLSSHNLSKAFPLSAVCYVFVLCMGWFIFHEKIMPLQLLGSTLIISGVLLIGTQKSTKKDKV